MSSTAYATAGILAMLEELSDVKETLKISDDLFYVVYSFENDHDELAFVLQHESHGFARGSFVEQKSEIDLEELLEHARRQ